MNFTQEDINANMRWRPGPSSASTKPPPPSSSYSSGGGNSGPVANTTPDSGTGSSNPDQPKKKVILRNGTFSPGPDGYAFTKTVKVKCEASEEGGKVGDKVAGLVNFALFTRYKGTEMDHKHSVDSGVRNGVAEGELTLYHDDGYYDAGMPEDQTVEYIFKATHQRGSSELVSEVLKMPQPVAPAELKKGMYDDKACAKYPNSRKKDANGYVAGTSIFDLQTNLKSLGFVDIGNADGDFGDKTDKAVRAFQDIAQKQARKDKASGNAVQVEATFTSATDGIVGQKTRDEIKLWLDKGYLKPDPILCHGHYDDDGSTNGKGERGGKDHQPGKPVVEVQNDLKKVAAYDGAVDGWFWDKMKDAVKLFQEWAAKGVFLIDGKETDIGEKLTRHKEGEVDGPTKAIIKKVVEKGGKVPAADYSSYVAFATTQKLLSKKSISILGATAKRTGFKSITISSTIRYPRQQAEAMYINLSKGKRLSYAAPGMAVTAVYDDCKKAGNDRETTIKSMVDKINSLSQEGKRVSKHCVSVDEYNMMNIVDVETPEEKAREFIDELAKSSDVVKIFHDISSIKDAGKVSRLAKEPCIHVEIKQ